MIFGTAISMSWVLALVAVALQLALGIVLGVFFTRRGILGRDPAADQAQEMIRGLFDWISTMVGDLDDCRSRMNEISQSLDEETRQDSQRPSVAGLVAKMIEANDVMQKRLTSAEMSLDRQARQINDYLDQARTDALTGLPNRRAFDEELARRMAEWNRYGVKFSLLLIDVDHFKQFNDTHGHLAGDYVLKGVAQRLEHTMRETDLVARFGGEEFAVLLTVTGAEEARVAALRVRKVVEEASFRFEENDLKVTVSCGLADALSHEEVTQLIKRADKALYAAKNSGRNCAFLHNGRGCQPIDAEAQPGCEHQSAEADLEESDLSASCDELRQRLLEVTSP